MKKETFFKKNIFVFTVIITLFFTKEINAAPLFPKLKNLNDVVSFLNEVPQLMEDNNREDAFAYNVVVLINHARAREALSWSKKNKGIEDRISKMQMGKGIYWPWVPQAFFNAMEKIVEEEEEFKRYVALAASAASAKDLSATKKYLGFATDKEIYRRIKNGITGITYASVAKISEATETYFNMQTALEKDIQEINEYEKAVVLLAQQKKRQADQEAQAAAVQTKRRQQQEELDKLKKEIENIK